MIKTGIYVDAENVRLNGGFGLRYDVLRQYGETGECELLRANSYLVEDQERTGEDIRYPERLFRYYDNLRRFGFKLIRKTVKKYTDDTGRVHRKANADLDLAIDALLQAENLDRIILLTGDGDFTRLVVALQNRGLRVEVIGFDSVSLELSRTADFYVSGFLVPGLVPRDDDVEERGHPSHTYEFWRQNGYGWLRYSDLHGDGMEECRIFFHRSALVEDYSDDDMSDPGNIFSFRIVPSDDREGQFKAEQVKLWRRNIVV